MSLHSHKASDAELKFERRAVGFFLCPSYLPWIGSHLNPEELERAIETTPGTRKDEPQRGGQTVHGREVCASQEKQSGRVPWKSWCLGELENG